MKCLLQRVRRAHVEIDAEITAAIEHGLLAFVCAEPEDTERTIEHAVDKILKLRIFSDDEGKMNRSLEQVQGGLLIVSQFTLAADTRKGNRPSFTGAAAPERARALYAQFVAHAKTRYPEVHSGVFGADMQVHLVNDGPVTIPMSFE